MNAVCWKDTDKTMLTQPNIVDFLKVSLSISKQSLLKLESVLEMCIQIDKFQ